MCADYVDTYNEPTSKLLKRIENIYLVSIETKEDLTKAIKSGKLLCSMNTDYIDVINLIDFFVEEYDSTKELFKNKQVYKTPLQNFSTISNNAFALSKRLTEVFNKEISKECKEDEYTANYYHDTYGYLLTLKEIGYYAKQFENRFEVVSYPTKPKEKVHNDFNKTVAFLYDLQKTQPLEEINFYPEDAHFDVYTLYECLSKMQKDYKFIKSFTPPEQFVYPYDEETPYHYTGADINNIWAVSLDKTFPKWAESTLNVVYGSLKKGVSKPKLKEHKITYFGNLVKYNGNQIAKTVLNSENDLVMQYLIDNPSKRISKKELEEKAVNGPLTKTLDKIVQNLGFKKDLRKMFFGTVSSDTIMFTNPITQEQFEMRGFKEPINI
jgi:hypothetical protein